MCPRLCCHRAARKAGHNVEKFVITLNSTYHARAKTLGHERYDQLLHWIKDELYITNPARVSEEIGDFYEFMSMYLTGHQLPTELFSSALETYKYQYGSWGKRKMKPSR